MEEGTTGRKVNGRGLSHLVLVNAVMWGLSIVGLIFVLQRAASARGLFVIMAVGMAVASQLMVAVRQRTRGDAG